MKFEGFCKGFPRALLSRLRFWGFIGLFCLGFGLS